LTDGLRFAPCGDRSVLLYLGDGIDPAVNDHVLALSAALRANPHPALVEVTGSYHCLLIEYDPLRIRLDQLEEMVRGTLQGPVAPPAARTVEIPVCYGGDFGPDLDAVADHARLTAAEVVRRHSSGAYRVYALGFSPGFPYLGGLDPAIHTPRLADPRVKVPGGSVGIGNDQTGIYPTPSPGGWQLIGRTPVRLFDAEHTPPAMLEPGDLIHFVPVAPEALAGVEPVTAPARPGGGDGRTGLRIIEPGMATTIQDLGRRGYMRYGVPVAGAADFPSLMVGNWLLGNRARTAGLEITLTGPELEFTGPVAFALTGAPAPAELIPGDGSSPRSVPFWTALLATPGDRLRIGAAPVGCRSYLCVAGGIDLPPVLGSLSEDLFGKIGPLGRQLMAGDFLPTGLPVLPPADLAGRAVPADAVPAYTGRATVRVIAGPHAAAFAPDALAALCGGEYVIGTNSDRQGLRLQGQKLVHAGSPDVLSEPLAPGSVQVPANGLPILLLGNRQTTGGYTQIAVAVYSDLAVAAQLRAGDALKFQEVDLASAQGIVWSERRRLAQVRRYLERDARRRPEQVEQEIAEQIARQAVQPPASVAIGAGAPEARVRARMLRLTIGGVEYEALVEDLSE
jgi:KipI family sensor histidine kinase inhibitor